MKLPVNVGIELLKAGKDSEQRNRVMLNVISPNVRNVEQLTMTEIERLNSMLEAFNKAVLTPKSLDDINLSLIISAQKKRYCAVLDNFSALDLTVEGLELVHNFKADAYDSIPFYVACMFARTVKAMFKLPYALDKVAYMLEKAIEQQSDFADIYALYAFFLSWKTKCSKSYPVSFKNYQREYRRLMRRQWLSRLILPLLWSSRVKPLKLFMIAVIVLPYSVVIYPTLQVLSLFKWIGRIPKSFRTKPKSSPKLK